MLILNNKNNKTDNSKIIVGSKAYSVKAKMKYLGATLTNNLKITQHLKEKKNEKYYKRFYKDVKPGT